MSPRSSAAGTRRTRERIVDRAVRLGSDEGLDSLSLGRLAGELGMSKAGVIGHFGTMDALTLAAVRSAVGVFRQEVWEPAAGQPEGLTRLLAVCDRWVDYLVGHSYVGGCFTSGEVHRVPEVRAEVRDALRLWRDALARDVAAAVAAGEIEPVLEAPDVAFAVSGIALATSQSRRLGIDPQVADRARRAMRAVIGVAG
jgi:AcrR family transcriptional regulator